MKTHILFAILTAMLMTACASNEGRRISSTADNQELIEYSKHEGNSAREVSRH